MTISHIIIVSIDKLFLTSVGCSRYDTPMAKSTALISNPNFRRKLASYLAAGESQMKIASRLGCNHSTISKASRHPHMKAAIEAAQNKYLRVALDPAVYALADIIASYPEYKAADDKEGLALSLKYADKLAQAVGIAPAHTPSILIQQMLSVQSAELSPAVQALMSSLANRLATRPDAVTDAVTIDCELPVIETDEV